MDFLSRPPAGPTRRSGPFPGPLPGFPPGEDPETYQLERVTRLLREAAYCAIFSRPDPARRNIPIPSPRNPNSLIGVEVHEELHRLEIRTDEPTAEGHIRARKRVGEPVASVSIRWMVIPDDFEAGPGRVPPPTELDPSRSQRFTMLDGQMVFKDRAPSSFHAFGTGRTFPVLVDGRPQLRIGAVIDILEAFGTLKDLPGTISVNGYLTPPDGLALNFILRFVDLGGKLRSTAGLPPLREIVDPDPFSVFLVFLGEPDPGHRTTAEPMPGGGLRASVYERLRLVDADFELDRSRGLRSRMREGLVAGSLRGALQFDPSDPKPVTPFQTTDGVFSFFDREGRTVGTLRANVVEGRAFRTALKGAPMPVFRFGGFGPFLGGSGPFRDAVGLMSLNAAISVFPRTLSNLYVLRVWDPDGRFHARCSRAGS